jgi:hypothetical protein
MLRTSPGAPVLTLRSWPFGAPSRRRLLELVLAPSAPKDGWSKATLERACHVAGGGLDDHLANLVGLGLLVFNGRRFQPVRPALPLARALRAALRTSAAAPDRPAAPLPRRAYRRAR